MSNGPDVPHGVSAVDTNVETPEALRALLDRVSVIVLTLGAAATLGSLVRVTSHGWHPNVVSDLVLYIAALGILLARKRFSVPTVLTALLTVAWSSGVACFVTLGLGTMALTTFATCAVIAGAAFGMRIGVYALAASVVTVTAVGVAMHFEAIPQAHVDTEYLTAPQTWLAQLLGFTFYTTAMLATVGSIQGRLRSTLGKLTAQSTELEERERMYRLLAENVNDVLFIQDMDLEFIYISPSAERLFGYTTEELKHITIEKSLTPESLQRALASFAQYSRQSADANVPVPLFELEYVRKDGSTFWGELSPTFLRDEQGRLTGSQGTLRDITDRKRAEAERHALESRIRQGEKLEAIGQLAGGIAHDFNNQLAGIMGYADLLREDLKDNETSHEFAEKIYRSTQRGAGLVEKLLAFARRGQYEQTVVDLHTVVDETIAILEHSIDKAIHIVRDFAAERANAMGDPTQLQNAVLNLAINARDAMPYGGMMTFATRVVWLDNAPFDGSDTSDEPGAYIELSVSDTGCGMKQNVLDRVFEPFFTTKSAGRGTGMGLAAVYGTVRNHGGTVTARSEEGEGSTFVVRLPVSHQSADKPPKGDSTREAKGTGRIFLVEDEEDVRAAMSAILRRAGYQVEAFANGKDAIRYYNSHASEVDLAILDLVLPDMSGKTIFYTIREVNPSAKALLISGYTADPSVQSLIDDSGALFLKKPFSRGELTSGIATLMNLP